MPIVGEVRNYWMPLAPHEWKIRHTRLTFTAIDDVPEDERGDVDAWYSVGGLWKIEDERPDGTWYFIGYGYDRWLERCIEGPDAVYTSKPEAELKLVLKAKSFLPVLEREFWQALEALRAARHVLAGRAADDG